MEWNPNNGRKWMLKREKVWLCVCVCVLFLLNWEFLIVAKLMRTVIENGGVEIGLGF